MITTCRGTCDRCDTRDQRLRIFEQRATHTAMMLCVPCRVAMGERVDGRDLKPEKEPAHG